MNIPLGTSDASTSAKKNPVTANIGFLTVGMVGLLLIVIFVLSFHFAPFIPKVFPKEHLTFKYSIITQSDIDTLINRFNQASVFERIQMRNNPLYLTLREQGLIVDAKDSTNNNLQ